MDSRRLSRCRRRRVSQRMREIRRTICRDRALWPQYKRDDEIDENNETNEISGDFSFISLFSSISSSSWLYGNWNGYLSVRPYRPSPALEPGRGKWKRVLAGNAQTTPPPILSESMEICPGEP